MKWTDRVLFKNWWDIPAVELIWRIVAAVLITSLWIDDVIERWYVAPLLLVFLYFFVVHFALDARRETRKKALRELADSGRGWDDLHEAKSVWAAWEHRKRIPWYRRARG